MSHRFTNLHVHSHYSLLEALPKIDDLIAVAKANGQTALALTDLGNMYGSIEFYKACIKAEIRPILGVDFFVAPRTRHDREYKTDDQLTRLVLLAKDLEGYKNLVKLVSISFTEGFFHRPRVDRELLERYHGGLVALIPALESDILHAVQSGASKTVHESLAWYTRTYVDSLFLEVCEYPEIAGHKALQHKVIAAAHEAHIPLVAAREISYLQPDDALARELVDHIRTARVLHRDVDVAFPDHSFVTVERAQTDWSEYPEALANTQRIADMCMLEMTLGKAIFPVFPIDPDTTDDAQLRELAESGYERRHLERTPERVERMEYELGIISKKGYSSYFLIVSDLLNHAREAGIYTNTRGSAAGSFVSYLCGITTVDPVAFNMPFERFLNPERPSAPDIDMDIADERRDEMIEYARAKYGDDHVVQIGTFGTMLARAAVRDVARALGFSYGIGDKIAKMIPFPKQGFPVSIADTLRDVPEFADVYKRDADARDIIDLAQKIEGNARHVGVHAAGVIIAPAPVTEYTPIQPDPKGGKTISQYDMYSITDEYGGVGLLKFDFLGLKNLSVLADSVLRVHDRLEQEVNLDRVPLDNPPVFQMLTRGETLGVFQMAGSGMTSQLRELRPSNVFDLNAMVALYRPGPMAFIPEYIARKHNPIRVTYLDPRLEPILKPTHGVLIYQDDVMMIAVQLAGYSWGEADKFRKAMGKKIPEEMAKQKDHFMTGCIERGMRPDVTQKLWDQIETFAAYGFNKAHAASYGMLAYKTAYMKANYPVDYMAAVLTADAGDVEKISEIVEECKRMGIMVLPPSVNESMGTFTVSHTTKNEKAIRFGLYSIKNFGTGVADSIIAARNSGGPFVDIADFLSRVPDKNVNKKQLEALIYSGALDCLGNRAQLIASVDLMLTFHRESIRAPSAQESLFAALAPTKVTLTLNPPALMSMDEKLAHEKELLGLYVSGHPLDKHRAKFVDERKTIKHTKAKLKGVETAIAGFIETVQTILTKKGDKMAFVRLADFTDAVEVVLFPKTYAENMSVVKAGNCVVFKGKLSDRKGEPSFLAEKVRTL